MSDVLVAVQDLGPGIEPEHLDKVFAAFYTTKTILELEWGSRFAGRSSPLMEVDCGQRPIGLGVWSFSSLCPRARKGLSGILEPNEGSVPDAHHPRVC